MNSEWTNSRIATNDGYVGKKTKPCCPCCRTSAASSAPVGTKETSNLPQGQQTQESASSLDDYDYEKGDAGKQPKAEKYTEIYGGGSKVIEKNEKYNTLPSNAARLPNKIYPSSGSSTWEDLTPHNNDNSYIHQVGSLPLPGADQLYHGRVVMHNLYQIPNPPTSYAPLPQPFNYGSSGCSCGGAAAPAPSCCASGCSCSGPAPPACCTSGCSCGAAPVPSCCTPVQPCCIQGGRCFKCTVGGEAKIVRPKRQAANCRDCTNNSIKSLIAQPSSTCSACIRSDMRAVRVKRMFQGCSQCSGRKKRSFNDCAQCSNLGQVLRRFKRSFIYTTFEAEETCDKTCCDYSKCPHLNAKKMAAFRQFLLSI
ncbi:hypothetical protein DICVIV_00246 [Dictyocaulus viviparus]|uniref:Uncharacterized protein n=1 Tax=Dictyocaulus viviparus TaxID=29172 RepID=A0A0D8Y9I0_DICVI|nr:hypothetical protein DICVIV_00246 [Dictyocaulus viviparus]